MQQKIERQNLIGLKTLLVGIGCWLWWGERGWGVGVNGQLTSKGSCGGACKNLFHKRKNLNNRKLDAIWHSNLSFISCLAISLSLHPNWQCITLL